MIYTLDYASLKRRFPALASLIPESISQDPNYQYRVDTGAGFLEVGYKSDNWVVPRSHP